VSQLAVRQFIIIIIVWYSYYVCNTQILRNKLYWHTAYHSLF